MGLDQSLREAAQGPLSHQRREMLFSVAGGWGGVRPARHCEVIGSGEVWGAAMCTSHPKAVWMPLRHRGSALGLVPREPAVSWGPAG